MANTYTQIHLHLIFAVRDRKSLIHESWEKDLHKYITGIVQSYNHKLIAINGMPDHIHLLIGLRPYQSISELMKQIKQSSSKWIKEQNYLRQNFYWQAGYGAFSCSKRAVPKIIRYIKNQKIHHAKRDFKKEYTRILQDQQIDFDPRYIFKNPI